MSSPAEEILKLYQTKNANFASRYSLDLLVALVIVTLFTLGSSYFSIIGQKAKYQHNWAKHRCDPAIMPFAGMINAPKGTDPEQYTAENFGVCVSTVLTAAEDTIQAGFDAVASGIVDAIVMAGMAAGDLAGFVSELRSLIGDLLGLMGGSGSSGGDSMQGVSNSLAQVHYALSGIVGAFMQSNQSGMGTTGGLGNMGFAGAEKIVWILMGMAQGLMLLVPIPIIGLVFVAIIIGLDIFGIAIEAAIAVIKGIFDLGLSMDRELNAATIKIYCFGRETPIVLKSGLAIPISRCRPGMETRDDGVISAIQKLGGLPGSSLLYDVRGTRVTGEHQLLHNGVWVDAAAHPDASCLGPSTEELWCLSTSEGTITVGGIRFADWEELDDDDLRILETAHSEKAALHKPLPARCQIRMGDGTRRDASRVRCGDVLHGGSQVCGEVEMLGGAAHLVTTTGYIPTEAGDILDYTAEIDSRLTE